MQRGAMAGVGLLLLAAGMAQACCGRDGPAGGWPALAFHGGWHGYGPAAVPYGPPHPHEQGWADGPGGPYGPPGYLGPMPMGGPYPGLPPEPVGPVPSDRGFVEPAPPPPAWRILAGHADGFEYVMLSDPEEHPRATMLKIQAPVFARVYFDNRELKQGYDGLWRYAPKEPLQLHLPNVHTIRAVVEYNGETLERMVTFRLQPGKLLKIRFD